MRGTARPKVQRADEAISLIRSGSTIAIGGAGGVGEPDAIIEALVSRYRRTGEPGNLTEIHPIRTGEIDGRGTSALGVPGLVSCMVGGAIWPSGMTELVERINDGEMEAYNLPIGILYAMLEATAAGRPGVVSSVGLDTCMDPRFGGGSLNSCSSRRLVERIEIHGTEYLFYRALPVDTAIIRATVADTLGNVSTEEEPSVCGSLLLAQAARASGGRTIVQVKRIVPAGTLDPRKVRIPGILVDAVVEHSSQWQTTRHAFDPTTVGDARMDMSTLPTVPREKRIVLRRALMEVDEGESIAIGAGLPGFLPNEAIRTGLFDRVTFTIEHGVIGGLNGYSAGGSTFPLAHNPEAIIDAADQLRTYAGGGVDIAFLGVGEIDSAGNVNVSRLGRRIPGSGGFIEITQGIRRVVFCTTLEGQGVRKFRQAVQQVTFSASRARLLGTHVRYVTERAVFGLSHRGLVLLEVAPGVDPQRDLQRVLDCDFEISPELQLMPANCFEF
nr:CoA-transferase [Paraburkholderia sp. Ac-20342]